MTDKQLLINCLPFMLLAGLVFYPIFVVVRYFVTGTLEIIKMIGGFI